MKCCGCVDLMGLLTKKDTLSKSHTRFCISELAAAINDLKPDNIRLSDFGLAKSIQNGNDKQLSNWQQFAATLKPGQLEQEQKEDEVKVKKGKMSRKEKCKKLYSTVGTSDYIAIEVLYQNGYAPSRQTAIAYCVCVRYFKKFLTSVISLHISRSIHVSNGTGQQVMHIRSEMADREPRSFSQI